VDVEPALANVVKAGLDNLGQFSNPALLSGVMADLSDARRLNLLELIHTHGLRVLNAKNSVIFQKLVALSSDLDHSSDGFFFDVQRLKAEV